MILFVKAIEEKIRETARDLHGFIMQNSEYEPMDCDETKEVSDLLRLELNMQNGNLSLAEYEEKEKRLFADQPERE